MSSSGEIITSDEEAIETTDENGSEVDLTINSTGDDEDANESVVAGCRSKVRRPLRIIDSDEDTDEEIEERAYSPRTRMSITGVRPPDFSDDSEIEYTDEEAPLSEISEQESSGSLDYQSVNTSMKNTTEETSAAEKSMLSQAKVDSFIVTSDAESSHERLAASNQISFSRKSALEKSALPTLSVVNKSETKESFNDDEKKHTEESLANQSSNSPFLPRYTQNFASDIKRTLSSTPCRIPNVSRDSSNDSDLQMLSKNVPLIEISSSDEENPVPVPVKNLVQPKIEAAINRKSASNLVKTPSKKLQFVSKDFYMKECTKLEGLKSELQCAEKLYEKLSKTLPDGGQQLKLRIERLNSDLQIKSNYIRTLSIEDINKPTGAVKSDQQNLDIKNKNIPGWDELSAAVNQIQPVHTGQRGMTNFINQKALTVERLKDLHGSIENCPSENVLADDPEGLRVTLMDHQKHALVWMRWRETQKPRGGILADDMGLGKTLTMISLVLDAKLREEISDAEESEKESDEEKNKSNNGWSSKGRRDYYHGGTLIVCPASLLSQWEDEVRTKVSRHKLTVCVHHGCSRDSKPRHLRTYDIVITTYHIVANEEKSSGAVYGIKWRRVILDEAHVIRNHKAKTSEAVCKLRSRYRWVLTGTPVQNKEMDVYALLKFLRCSPFDELANWKTWINNKSAGGQQRLNTIMKSLMLRRTKVQLQERGELQSLPEKRVELIEIQLDKEEMNVYQKIMIFSRSLFVQFLMQRAERNTDLMYRDDANRPTFMQTKDPNGAYYKVHQKLKNLHHGNKEVKSHEILVLLLRLRQICCHPGLINAMIENIDEENIDPDSNESQPEIDLLEQFNKMNFEDNASGDSNSVLGSSNDNNEVFAKASARILHRSNPVFDFERPSSKIKIIIKTLKECTSNSNDKAIVVSQWTSVLNIIKNHLHGAGIATLELNGTVAVKNRQDIVTSFNDQNNDKKVLLLSLTAGGVGLNLVGANHLLLIDLHWNPQLESQAQDRIYRVGQKKNIVVYKFMCKDTVEERIKALQDRKLAIANGVLTGVKSSEGSKLSIEDLKGLFGI